MEDAFVDVERKRGRYVSKFGMSPMTETGVPTLDFLMYIASGNKSVYSSMAREYTYTDDQIQAQIVAHTSVESPYEG